MEHSQLSCPHCGNTELAFIAVAHSKKHTGILLTLISVALFFVFAFLVILIGTGITILDEVDGLALRISVLSFIVTIGGLLLDILTIVIFIGAYKKLIPYYNENKIHYVCKSCGHHAVLDKIEND